MEHVDLLAPKTPPISEVPRGDVHSPLSMDSLSSRDSCPQDHEKKKPIGDHLRSKVHSPESMDSSSCLSYLQDQEKNGDEGAAGISSAGVVASREFFLLVPDQNTKEVGHPRQEIVPAQLKRKSMASLADPETFIVEKTAKYKRTQRGKEEASGCDPEEVSTELTLLFDPYKIKKRLTQSDLGHLSRLLIGRDFVKSHFLRWMSEETVRQVESSKGADVIVRDMDTCSEHRLVFVFWASSGSYVLKGGWIKEFVKRRGLAAGDEVGIYWEPSASKFHFSLLHKAN
ncbi:hypothetical protein EUGRSUZ_E02044 [Eucalyptus grandis]|uniref:Uncharacterized protein n=2 Tax=Eucalyptus grandis TaxID=71139 RepID=A0ACC3KVT9_EUCGR|nr:hypothetical protein EUGRSUZ_E02044 [Eucalyptus grandis]